jgi:hypothetical protein
MRWEGHVARMEAVRNAYTVFFFLENVKGRDHLEELGIDGKIL